MAIFGAYLLIIMFIIAFKVIRIVRCGNKMILALLIMMNLTAIASIVDSIFSVMWAVSLLNDESDH